MYGISKYVIITLMLLMVDIQHSFCQVSSKNVIKVGFGLGISMDDKTEGIGMIYSIGYEGEIWNERLRINPNICFGQYSTRLIMDTQDKYFSSNSIQLNVYYDLVKAGPFSLVAGSGGFLNGYFGLRGTGGMYSSEEERPDNSEYFTVLHYGGYFGFGFRINSTKKKVTIEIMPCNIYAGNKGYFEVFPKISLGIKL